MSFLSHTAFSSGCIQDFLDYYVDQCRFSVVNVGRKYRGLWPIMFQWGGGGHCRSELLSIEPALAA